MSSKLKIVKQVEEELLLAGRPYLSTLQKSYIKLAEKEIDPNIGLPLLVANIVKMEMELDELKKWIIKGNAED